MHRGVQDLVEKLIEANRSYYDAGESELEDDEYDSIRDYLIGLGVEVSTLTPPSKGSEWPIRQHSESMTGIDLCARNGDEWTELVDSQRFMAGTVSIKYDGLSVEMVYKDGVLINCVLRGDGTRGEDVYANARRICGVPSELDDSWLSRWIGEEHYDGHFSVFGEIVVSWNNLNVINEMRLQERKKPYKSPRSAVSMVRGRGNSHLMQYLMFRPFRVSSDRFGPRQSMVNLRRASGEFQPVDMDDHVTPADAWRRLKVLEGKRSDYRFQMDGVVYADDSGTVVKLKFSPESAVTAVTNVVEQLGRTGVVAPVVEFLPVELAGATVTRATGHNAVLMESRLEGLGVGARILVSRRGEVIPHIERVISPSRTPWQPGEECPSCGSPVLAEGSIRRCTADPGECSGTSAGLLVKFCRSIGIEGVGPAMATTMVTHGMAYTPGDLYTMDPAILAMCGNGVSTVGEAVARKVFANIVQHRSMTWGELLGAIGIPGCAGSVMEDVSRAFPDPDDLRSASRHDLAEVHGVGPGRADKIAAYVDTRWDDVIQPLIECVDIKVVGDQLSGKSFCITLSLRSCGRTEMEARIRRAGGVAKSSVSGKLDYLVCNSPDSTTTKIRRAKELGVPIISEDDLISMMGGDHSEPVEADISQEDPF